MIKKFLITSFILIAVLWGVNVLAADQTTADQTTIVGQELKDKKSSDVGLMSGTGDNCYSKGDCSVCDFIVVINNIGYLLRNLLGGVALLMFVIGGAYWLFSGGVEARVTTGKTIIKNSIIGLIIFFGAFTMINYVLYALINGEIGANQNLGNVSVGGKAANGSFWYNFQCTSWTDLKAKEEKAAN